MRTRREYIIRGTGIVSIIAGLVVLSAWIFSFKTFTFFGAAVVFVKPNIAIGFILAGIALIIFTGSENTRSRRVAFSLASFLFILGGITFLQYTLGFNAGIDQLLVPDNYTARPSYPGRMSPGAAICLWMLGSGFMLIQSPGKLMQNIGQYLFHIVTLLSLIAIIGYLYDVPSFYALSSVNPMVIHTAVILFIISIAASFIRPALGITGLLTGRQTGNLMAKRLFPVLVIIVILLGYARILTNSYGLLSVNFGIALFVVSFLILGLIVIWNTAIQLNRLDIKREQFEKKLIASESQLRQTMDHMMEGAQIIGFDWRYLYVNETLARHAKYSKEELLGHTVFEKYPGFENTTAYKAFKRCFDERVPIHLENEFTFPDGSSGWFELSFQPVPEGVFVLSVDITERKKAEEELIRSKDVLEQRAKELEASNADLERFAYVASHDLQEPLRMVSSFLHLLEKKMDGQLDEQGKQYIQYAVGGADRMKQLIMDLLLYSRVGTNKDAMSVVDCNEVLEEVKSTLVVAIREKNAVIQAQSMPLIKAVRSQVFQLFQNLITNALKYSGDKPPIIEVGCRKMNWAYEFFVKDNGIGIERKFFDKIFIIFQRLHNKTDYSGTGIGLAICKKIVERHRGTMRVESEPGKGSTFYFTIPQT
jgi:PAS domain S-box-containing protein